MLPLLLVACLLVSACAPDPVQWDPETRPETPMPAGSRLAFDAGGAPVIERGWMPPVEPTGSAQCAGSLMATTARGDTAFAVWWSPRADSSALLVVARSDDSGHSWRKPEIADSTDHGRNGCARPAPFIAADTTNGYVHVVYFMVAAEGPGVFFTHSMGGGEMFHSPVPLMYGDRASAAAVACNGDTVAVAFVDPNGSTPQMWLALSRTTGHIFESRMEVSPSTVRASGPAVAVRGHRVAISWVETNREGGAGVTVQRTGRWQ